MPFSIAFSDIVGNDGTTVTTTTNSSTVTIDRVNLTALSISNGMLTPIFASGIITYTTAVAYNINSVTILPIAEDPSATIKVNGTNTVSGSMSAGITLNLGNNVIPIAVTSPDGSVTKTYTITIIRAKQDQTITFNTIPIKAVDAPDFDPIATASSGLTVTYTLNNPAVAIIVFGKIHIVGPGIAIITCKSSWECYLCCCQSSQSNIIGKCK